MLTQLWSCIQPGISALPHSAQIPAYSGWVKTPSLCSITQLERCLPSLPYNKKSCCPTGFVRSWKESQLLHHFQAFWSPDKQSTGSFNNLGSLWTSMDELLLNRYVLLKSLKDQRAAYKICALCLFSKRDKYASISVCNPVQGLQGGQMNTDGYM